MTWTILVLKALVALAVVYIAVVFCVISSALDPKGYTAIVSFGLGAVWGVIADDTWRTVRGGQR